MQRSYIGNKELSDELLKGSSWIDQNFSERFYKHECKHFQNFDLNVFEFWRNVNLLTGTEST